MSENEDPLLKIQHNLSYTFQQPDILKLALTHPSYAHEHPQHQKETSHNQRLEFLGDAVLDFLVAAWLYRTYSDFSEGTLTRLRATLVRTTSLAKLAQNLELGDALRLGRGEEESGGQRRSANLCDTLEAVVGALYLDAGLQVVWRCLEPWFVKETQLILAADSYVDAKSRFQEWAQAEYSITPEYEIIDEQGPDHAKIFTAQVLVGERVVGKGNGASKRMAEQSAAQTALTDISKDT